MRSTMVWLVLALCVGARGEAAFAETRTSAKGDAIPAGISTYVDPSAAARVASYSEPAELHYSLDADPAASGAEKPQSYWPVLYSALMPGVGELTMGYTVRGILLMAVEVAAWTGYITYHSDGMDERDAYEAYADQYWSEDKFVDDHPLVYPLPDQTLEYLEEQGRAVSGSGGDWWTGYIPYVSKEEDKQHYYENLGKYDWFVSGWSDYDPTVDPPVAESAQRETYRGMRAESNDDLDTANEFIWASLAARVFSIAETAIIVHNRREKDTHAAIESEAPFAVRARPRGFDGGEVALEVRFK